MGFSSIDWLADIFCLKGTIRSRYFDLIDREPTDYEEGLYASE